MSKRISFKKLGEKLGKSTNVSSGTPAPIKGVVIGEKCIRESLASLPSKKGKVDDGSKGKGIDREPEGNNKATSSSKAPTTLATVSSLPGEGTSANLGIVLGPTASILGSPSVAEKLLRGVIPLVHKEKVEKLILDQTATKFFSCDRSGTIWSVFNFLYKFICLCVLKECFFFIVGAGAQLIFGCPE